MFQEVVVSLKLHLLTYSRLGWLNDTNVDLGLAPLYRFEGWKNKFTAPQPQLQPQKFFSKHTGRANARNPASSLQIRHLTNYHQPTHNMSDEQNSGAGKFPT